MDGETERLTASELIALYRKQGHVGVDWGTQTAVYPDEQIDRIRAEAYSRGYKDGHFEGKAKAEAEIERIRAEAFAAGEKAAAERIAQEAFEGGKAYESKPENPLHRAMANNNRVGGLGFAGDQVYWLGRK